MQKSLLLFIFLLYGSWLFAQKQVSGYAYDSVDKLPLPAVVVTQTQTTNEVITDSSGRFSITLPSDTASLNFSYIGYKPKKLLPNSDTIYVYLQPDESQLVPISAIDVFYYNTLNVGYSGGVRYTPVGATLQGNATYLVGIPIFTGFDLRYHTNLDKNKDLSWSIIKRIISTQDKYLDNRGYRFDLVAYGRNADFCTRDSLKIDEKGLNTYFTVKSYIVTAGIGYQQISHSSEGQMKNVGVALGAGYSFPFGSYVLFTNKYWQDYWQFDVNIRQRIGQTGFTILTGAEKVLSYNEVKVGVIYSFKSY